MIEVIWEFRVKPQHVADFERDYSSMGPWAALFRGSPAYHGTRLLRDREDRLRFLTVDTWNDAGSYELFRYTHAKQYEELDRGFERLTDSEQMVGIFEVF